MLTLALYGLLAVLLIGGIYLLAAWLLPTGEQIAPPVRDEPIWSLPPERALAAADVADVRLPVALRGYRFAETDLLLDRLVEELRARDEEIARLRKPATAPGPSSAESGERAAKPTPAKSTATSLEKSTSKPAAQSQRPAGVDAVAAAAAKSQADKAAAPAKSAPAAEPKPTPAVAATSAAEPKPAPAVAATPAAEPKTKPTPAADPPTAAGPKPTPAAADAPAADAPAAEPKPRRPAARKRQPAPPPEHVERVEQGGHDG
ncbi:MAG: hypothetical protein QOF95_527 [Pseudonocardiales bacterium]|nr:hypothetical protein [Pseudonocardiales bacterium]